MSPEIATVVVAGILAGVVAMIKFAPQKDNPGDNSLNNKYVRKDMCDQKMGTIEEKIDGLCEDVKELLKRR